MRRSDFDTFMSKFFPLEKNEGNILFETYGEDWEKLKSYNSNFIWTLLDCDGKLYVSPGIHFVNRLNYIVTKIPWSSNQRDYLY